jgi:hypothetical protein
MFTIKTSTLVVISVLSILLWLGLALGALGGIRLAKRLECGFKGYCNECNRQEDDEAYGNRPLKGD